MKRLFTLLLCLVIFVAMLASSAFARDATKQASGTSNTPFSFAPGTWSGESVFLFKGGWSGCVGTPFVVYNIQQLFGYKTPGLQSAIKGLAGLNFHGSTNTTAGYALGLQYTEPLGRAGVSAGIAQLFILAPGTKPSYGFYVGGFITFK